MIDGGGDLRSVAHLATFARVYVSDIEEGIALFSSGENPRLRISHGSGLELALVGEVLILAGPPEVIEPFRSTQVTVIVDDLDVAIADVAGAGGRIRRQPAHQPTGRNVTISYANGADVEYVEWSATTRAQVGV